MTIARSEDRIDWAAGTPRQAIHDYVRWEEAVRSADAGDCRPLISLLQSKISLGPDVRDLVADLLKRNNLKKKRGGQKTPAYVLTQKEARLADLYSRFRYFRRSGIPNSEAIRAALRDDMREGLRLKDDPGCVAFPDDRIDELISDQDLDKLENLVMGRRGAARRKQRKHSALE